MKKSNILKGLLVATLGLSVFIAGCGGPAAEKKESGEKVLNIYSTRHYDADKDIYEMFTKETGIKVNVVEGKDHELVEKIIREKDAPQADVFLTVGAESIYPLKEAKMLQTFDSKVVKENIPEHFRGDGWTSIMYRARVIAYEKGKTNPESIKSYNDLTKPEYKGQILVRPSSASYNVALLSSFILLDGEKAAKEWAQGVANNLARTPKGNDRDQAKAIVAGEGSLAIMNSYYYVRMLNSSDPAEKEAAQKIGLIFPDKTHINISYAGLLTGAKNKDNAIKFIEFMTGQKVQEYYAKNNGEFPVNPKVPMTEVQKSWGSFTTQKYNFEELGKYAKTASKIFDEVGWK